MYLERYNMDNEQKLYDDNFATEGQLKRIADAIEEILRMVKTDQERAQEARAHYKMEEEQTKCCLLYTSPSPRD